MTSRRFLTAEGFGLDQFYQGRVLFTDDTPQQVLAHHLKSGTGTADDQALDVFFREDLHEQFLERCAQVTKPVGR